MKRSILGVLLVLIFVAVGIAATPTLTFHFKDVRANKTAKETDTYAVNNAGVIAGDYVDSAGVQHGMILAGKRLYTIDKKNCDTGVFGVVFYGINSAGRTAGYCVDAKTGHDVAFSYSYRERKFKPIVFPGSTGTDAWGINDKEDVVGDYYDSAGTQHGFVKKGSQYTTIDVKGDTSTTARGINNAGDITVYAYNSSNRADSFLYTSKGKHIPISDPNAGGEGTQVHTPNNKGDIDGTYYDSVGNQVGFLLHGGTYYDVKDPKADNNTRADGLNDKLEIVGRYSPSPGTNVGFKATTTQ